MSQVARVTWVLAHPLLRPQHAIVRPARRSRARFTFITRGSVRRWTAQARRAPTGAHPRGITERDAAGAVGVNNVVRSGGFLGDGGGVGVVRWHAAAGAGRPTPGELPRGFTQGVVGTGCVVGSSVVVARAFDGRPGARRANSRRGVLKGLHLHDVGIYLCLDVLSAEQLSGDLIDLATQALLL